MHSSPQQHQYVWLCDYVDIPLITAKTDGDVQTTGPLCLGPSAVKAKLQ